MATTPNERLRRDANLRGLRGFLGQGKNATAGHLEILVGSLTRREAPTPAEQRVKASALKTLQAQLDRAKAREAKAAGQRAAVITKATENA